MFERFIRNVEEAGGHAPLLFVFLPVKIVAQTSVRHEDTVAAYKSSDLECIVSIF